MSCSSIYALLNFLAVRITVIAENDRAIKYTHASGTFSFVFILCLFEESRAPSEDSRHNIYVNYSTIDTPYCRKSANYPLPQPYGPIVQIAIIWLLQVLGWQS